MAPKYVLEPDYVKATVGEAPVMHFTVTSEPPLPQDVRHTLTHQDSTMATKRFKIEKDSVTFRDLRLADSGFYTISCSNSAGLVGKETLELEVKSKQVKPSRAWALGNDQTCSYSVGLEPQ